MAAESLADRKKRAGRVRTILKKLYPDADCALERTSALQLLVATILSAQSTDVTVNKVTPVLFKRYPKVGDLATANHADVEEIIKSTGFFRQKAKSIINASSQIMEKFDGQVPDTMDELIELPGIARKTANVVLGTWFGKNEGIAVDTHVGRLAHRLGLTWTSKDTKDAVKIEQDLMQLFPKKDWSFLSHALIWHGRLICQARKPNCRECKLNKVCPSAFQFDEGGKHTSKKGK
ncbi:MAG: endonuclease III [Planctomycetota bacterium]|jgi:endonuclease-3